MTRRATRGVALSLLSGQADLLSQFDVVLEQNESGAPRLRLTPKKPDPEVERVFLETDAQNRITAIEVRTRRATKAVSRSTTSARTSASRIRYSASTSRRASR